MPRLAIHRIEMNSPFPQMVLMIICGFYLRDVPVLLLYGSALEGGVEPTGTPSLTFTTVVLILFDHCVILSPLPR